MVANGGGADLEIDYFSNLAEVSERMKFESERGDPDDGWEFSVKKFNQLEDLYPLLPADIRETETPWDIVHLLTEYDEDFMDWLVAG